MLNHQTLDKLNQMKLFGMAKGFEEFRSNPSTDDLNFTEAFGMLVDREETYRQSKRLERLSKGAKFKHAGACIENLDYHQDRGLKKKQILDLIACNWIEAHQNIVICGPTGAGKSYLACALGQKACREGLPVLFFRAPRLYLLLAQAKAMGTYLKELSKIEKAKLLIIDDFGVSPMTDVERRDLLELLDDRDQTRSTIITSQFVPSKWHSIIGDETIADAICDRLIHNAHRINLNKTDSLRKKYHTLENGR